MTVRHDIAFLHTAQAHVATFDTLMRTLAPTLSASHTVRADLLADAQEEGLDSPALIGRVHAALASSASGNAAVVVCTCSTLGGIAEAADATAGPRIVRVDRAMADEAARRGRPVLLVATLASTFEPTAKLLRSSAARVGADLSIRELLVPDAWAHFQAGRLSDHIDSIVSAIEAAAPADMTVVLAQASMAPAAEPLAARGIDTLTSPRLGVESAVALAGRHRVLIQEHTMKAIAVFAFAVAVSLSFAAPAQAQQTMRCKNDLAQVGDGKASVLKKCGEPVAKDSFCKPVEQQQLQTPPNNPSSPVTVNVLPCEQVEEWTYNPGRGQFMTTLRFESGTLRSLKYGDRVQ